MQVQIKGKEIPLNPSEVKRARGWVANVLKEIKEIAIKNDRFSYYLTTLIMMHIMTGNILSELDEDALESIMQFSIEQDKKKRK